MEGSMADYEGSWSCIERRAQTEAVALIKTPDDLSQALGKEGWEKHGKKPQRGEKDKEEEIGKAREAKNTRKSLPPPLDTASAGLL